MWVAGRSVSRLFVVFFIPVALALLGVAAYAVDSSRHEGRVARNVHLDDRPIGGRSLDEMAAALHADAHEYGGRPVRIDLGDQVIEGTAATYGFTLDVAASMAAIERASTADGFWNGLTTWLSRFTEPAAVRTEFRFDAEVAREALEREAERRSEAPRQPSIHPGEDGLELDSGAAGRRVDIDGTLQALAAWPDEVVGLWESIPTDVSPGDAIALFTRLNRRIGDGFTLVNTAIERTVPEERIASWLTVETRDGELVVDIDEEEIYRHVESRFFGYAQGALVPTFDVVEGVPVPVQIDDTRRICCEPGVVDEIVARITGDVEGPLRVPLRSPSLEEQAADIEALGVREDVGSFTTQHRCCESRVINIHRIADLTRGVLIAPGEDFSVNTFVGERTVDKGFVEGGVIYQGVFERDIGGGISQFATTLFNAAFLAGLDFAAYQSHSLYLDRYPYGREATLSWPEPDLIITNSSPYAVLLWSSYDDRSITVSLYSTRHVIVTQTDQTEERWRSCTRVTTRRLREYTDGSSVEDAVYALYRPSAGTACEGLSELDGETDPAGEDDEGDGGAP